MNETWNRNSSEIPKDHEDEYVKAYREECSAAGMSNDEIESDDEIRERYKEARDVTLRHSREHLSEMRDLLNGLVIKYTESVANTLNPTAIAEMESKFPRPILLPETESLIQFTDNTDGYIAAEDLRKTFGDIFVDLSDKDVISLAREIKHLHTNASLLTEDNLRLGGDRARRELRESFSKFKQSLGNSTDETPQHHTPFASKLGLKKNQNGVLWGKLYETEDLPELPLHRSHEVLPVGEYGEQFTKRLVTSMQLMIKQTKSVKDEAFQLVRDNSEQFEHTARGSESRHDFDSAALRALQEGVISLFQAVHLLTAEKIEGFETGDDLFQAIVERDLLKELAYVCPPGVIGPVTLAGKHIRDLLVVDDDELVKINPDIRQMMLARKKGVVAEKVEDLLRMHEIGYERDPRLPSSGRGCPVAYINDEFSTAGISELSKLAYQIFSYTK